MDVRDCNFAMRKKQFERDDLARTDLAPRHGQARALQSFADFQINM
jgi:hypothetical protein